MCGPANGRVPFQHLLAHRVAVESPLRGYETDGIDAGYQMVPNVWSIELSWGYFRSGGFDDVVVLDPVSSGISSGGFMHIAPTRIRSRSITTLALLAAFAIIMSMLPTSPAQASALLTPGGPDLYDQSKAVQDGIELYDGSRGLTWAVMQHRQTEEALIVYGIHPLCCSGEENHLNAMNFATDHMAARQQYPNAPVIFMGDFNAQEFDHSQVLLRDGQRNAYNRMWTTPMRFTDTFRAARGPLADARTLGNIRVDYIYTENRGGTTFQTNGASIRRDAPGGSDHWPIMAEVTLKSAASR